VLALGRIVDLDGPAEQPPNPRPKDTIMTMLEQLDLPGQAAAPRGPIDLTNMFVMHHGFRRDITNFTDAVQRTPLNDRRTWRALQKRWRNFGVVLHHHHSGEDVALWPLLLERSAAAGDADATATLHAMEAEHEEIDPLLAACEHGFAALAKAPGVDARAALEVRIVSLRERLREHLVHEETGALPLVQRHLAAADWAATEKHFARTATPAYIKIVLPWVMHDLPPDGRRAFCRQMPGPIRVAERLLRFGFLRLERRAFRHV
jgi:iron-sulfur cluster repair protein YtfE (RIC family)